MKKGTIIFKNKPAIIASGSIVGKRESEGPLSQYFDETVSDGRYGEKTWEQAESKFQQAALSHAMNHAHITTEKLDCIFSGDLLNQCVASSFAYRDNDVPFLGLYGACSTFAEGLALSALFADGGYSEYSAVCVSSHFCTAERQYRNPLSYGGQRPPSAQRTVTGAGAVIVSPNGAGQKIKSATFGAVIDSGIKDSNNMGAAMAPAAYETLKNHFENTNTKPADYDLIATGDLGEVGRKIVIELFSRDGVQIENNYIDCGCKMFDNHRQDMHAGASGAACSATVFAAYILEEMKKGVWKRVLFAGTGSLQSPLTVQQKETIPSVCHAVEIMSEG